MNSPLPKNDFQIPGQDAECGASLAARRISTRTMLLLAACAAALVALLLIDFGAPVMVKWLIGVGTVAGTLSVVELWCLRRQLKDALAEGARKS